MSATGLFRSVVAGSLLALVILIPSVPAAPDDVPAPILPIAVTIEDATCTLRLAGRYSEADSLAREMLRQRQGDPAATPESVEIDSLQEETLSRLVAQPLSEQVAFQKIESDYAVKKECWNAKDYALFSDAQTRYQRAVERIFGHDSYETVRHLINAEQDYRNWGRYVQAEHCAREALAISQRLFPAGHPLVIGATGGLACALMSQGRMDEAELLFRMVLASAIADEGDRSSAAASGYNSLGVTLAAEGDYEGAAEMLRLAEEIQRANCGFDHEIFLSNYARALIHLGQLDEAELRVRKSLGIYMSVHGDSCSEVAGQLASLAQIKRLKGDLVSADSLYACAATIDRNVLGPQHPEFLHPEICRAEIQLQLGRPAAARCLLEPLLHEMDPALRVSERSQCLHVLGRALHEQGRSSEAERCLTESARLYERARDRAGGEFRRATMNLVSPYSDLALCRLDLGRPDQAWVAVESGLGRCLEDLLLADRSRSGVESARADSVRQTLNDCEERLAVLTGQLPADRSLQSAKRRAEADLLDAEASWSHVQSEFLRSRRLFLGEGVSLARVQGAMKSGTAIVGWVDGDDAGSRNHEAWGYVLRKFGPVHWVRLPSQMRAPRADEPTPAALFHDDLVEASAREVRASLNSRIEGRARRIADERIVPLLPFLTDIHRLVVIPSGPMLGIPVEAMKFADGTWLSDRFEVVYSPSATVLAELVDARRVPLAVGNRILLVGDPLLLPQPKPAARVDLNGGLAWSSAASSSLGSLALNRGASSATGQITRFLRPLPQSRTEIQVIATMFSDATTLLGARASMDAIRGLVDSGEIARFRNLHFATHALVDDQSPDRSGLVLSQVYAYDSTGVTQPRTPTRDGILSMKQILRDWRLDADLVTLSGCSTALGRPSGGEGTLGLRKRSCWLAREAFSSASGTSTTRPHRYSCADSTPTSRAPIRARRGGRP